MKKMKYAVVIGNLGGPESLEGIRPFLFSMFSDKNIVPLPTFIRVPLALLISLIRPIKTKAIYIRAGGKSPILASTQRQARALRHSLSNMGEFQVFIYMRYSGPTAKEVMETIKEYEPDKIILLPLYPQYSITTTGSFFEEWQKVTKGWETIRINHFYDDPLFIRSYSRLIRTAYEFASGRRAVRIIFSAHGLPENIIKKGDLYEKHIKETVQLLIQSLKIDNLDWRLAYQSRVGFAKWLTPYLSDEIVEASKKGFFIILVPISFVSENVEVTDELDIEYKELAMSKGASGCFRVSTPGTDELFIECLTQKIKQALEIN